MDVARSEPQGAHYHADVIYLLPQHGIMKIARTYTNSVPSWQSTLAFLTRHVLPMEHVAGFGSSRQGSSQLTDKSYFLRGLHDRTN